MSVDGNLLCRICANTNQDNCDIFGNNSQMSKLIFKYLSVSIEICDEISTKICNKCKDNVCNFHDFAQQCERAQKFLMTHKKNIIKGLDCVQNLKSEFNEQFEIKEEIKHTNSDDDHYVDTDYFGSTQETTVNEIKEEIDPLKKAKRKTRKQIKRLGPKPRKKNKPTLSKEKERNLPINNEMTNNDVDKTESHILEINGRSIDIKKEKITDIDTINAILEFSRNNNVDITNMNICRRSLKQVYLCEIFKFFCHVCNLKFNDWKSLESHTKSMHKTNPEVLCVCLKKLYTAWSIRRHWYLHKPDKPLSCSDCSRRFSRKSLLDSHMFTHLPRDQRPFVCHKCDLKFASQLLLKQHEKKHVPVKDRKIHLCEVCKLKFTTKTGLITHMQSIHQHLKPFVCDQCGRAFATKTTLADHLFRHGEARPHVCNVCQKSFKTKQNLSTHMYTHNNRVHKCPYCPANFKTKRYLTYHLCVHNSVTRYQCSLCDKAFKRSKDLKCHINFHTGKRPYSCPWCTRTFVNGSNCRAHKRRMHPNELLIADSKTAKNIEMRSSGEKIESEDTVSKILCSNINPKSTTSS